MSTRNLALPGKIYLLEAPATAPALLGENTIRLLRHAEVVLHDNLVPSEFLDLVPASAHVRNVGPHGTHPALPADQINSLLAAAARDGHLVLRITAAPVASSAPGTAGSAPADLDALRRLGIPVEILPAAACAHGAAYARMP